MGQDLLDALRQQAAATAFPIEGTLEAPGLEAEVTIDRDAHGVPHIEAQSLHDLWFAQGLVTAGERLFQLDLAIRAATGRLSEFFGERMLDADRFARTIGLHLAGRRYVQDWTDQDREMHGAFVEGARTWLDLMPAKPIEYQLLDLQPDLPEDPAPWAACFAYLAWGLSNNFDKELLRAGIRERLGDEAVDLLMPPSAGGSGLGSNAWAVSGSKTKTGKPLLANDPHLPALQPGPWIQIGLKAPGYEVIGVALTFTPGVILGRTPHHAWAATNVTGDVQDLFEVTPRDVTAEREEHIRVRGEPEPRIFIIQQTRFGPVLTHEPVGILKPRYAPIARTYAIRWTGHEHGLRPSLALDAATAMSFEEFRKAALRIGCPGQNFVYADVDGTIGYQCTGMYPIRRTGDGTQPSRADSLDPGEDGWTGWIPSEELPHVADPAEGFVVSANDGLHAERSSYLISRDFHEPHRAERIAGLLRARDDHDIASMAAIQTDTVSIPARRTLPLLLQLEPETAEQKEALALLADWDGDMAADSRAAALYNAWCARIAERALHGKMGDDLCRRYTVRRETWHCQVLPDLLRCRPSEWLDDDLLRAALEDALKEADGKAWGELHTLELAHPLASIPGLEPLFVAARVPYGGDEQTVSQGASDGLPGHQPAIVASWRAVFDLSDPDANVSVVPTGVSGNPASSHWNDQTELYANGQTRPTPLRFARPRPLRLLPWKGLSAPP
jgi:penicillin amidase